MPVVPPLPRFKVEKHETMTRIIIPSRKNWGAILFSIMILIPWGSVEFGTLSIIMNAVKGTISGMESFSGSLVDLGIGWAMLLVWFFLWTVAGGFAIYPLLWNLAGQEVIGMNSTSLTVTQKIISYSRPKEYDFIHIRDLRVSQPSYSPWPAYGLFKMFWGLSEGIIAFDYGAKTYRFGSGLDEAEAKMILAEITQRYPQYASRSK